jgi:hypothetical protein
MASPVMETDDDRLHGHQTHQLEEEEEEEEEGGREEYRVGGGRDGGCYGPQVHRMQLASG